MADTSNNTPIPLRDLSYYRRRNKNRLFSELVKFFSEEAEKTGITKKDIAEKLNKDPASVTRWLSQPSNLTSDTVSDLLLALNAEMDYGAALFAHRAELNAMRMKITFADTTTLEARSMRRDHRLHGFWITLTDGVVFCSDRFIDAIGGG